MYAPIYKLSNEVIKTTKSGHTLKNIQIEQTDIWASVISVLLALNNTCQVTAIVHSISSPTHLTGTKLFEKSCLFTRQQYTIFKNNIFHNPYFVQLSSSHILSLQSSVFHVISPRSYEDFKRHFKALKRYNSQYSPN